MLFYNYIILIELQSFKVVAENLSRSFYVGGPIPQTCGATWRELL